MNITEESKEFETPQVESIQEAIEALKQTGNVFKTINVGNEEVRLFQSYSNQRLPEESYYEYKIRQYIMKESLKSHKRNGYSGSNV
jgi:precorrin-6x reductase